MKKILITGVAGFIGYHLSEKLLNNNYHIIGIDNLNDYYDPNLKKTRLDNLNRLSNLFIMNKRTIATIQIALISFFMFADQNLLGPNLTLIAEDFDMVDVKDQYLGGLIPLVFLYSWCASRTSETLFFEKSAYATIAFGSFEECESAKF